MTEEDGTERRFSSGRECCRHYGLSESALSYRIKGLSVKDKRIFRYGKVLSKEPGNKGRGRGLSKPFNPEGHNEVSYEEKYPRVPSTLCSIKKDVYVGSYRCKICSRHHGQDCERHIVACG